MHMKVYTAIKWKIIFFLNVYLSVWFWRDFHWQIADVIWSNLGYFYFRKRNAVSEFLVDRVADTAISVNIIARYY